MAGTPKLIASPAYLSSSIANIYTPAAATILTLLLHIHIANVTGGSVTFTLYKGATAGSTAGTELFKAEPIAANAHFDYYCRMPMTSTDFLSGLASAATSLVITVEGEQTVIY